MGLLKGPKKTGPESYTLSEVILAKFTKEGPRNIFYSVKRRKKGQENVFYFSETPTNSESFWLNLVSKGQGKWSQMANASLIQQST